MPRIPSPNEQVFRSQKGPNGATTETGYTHPAANAAQNPSNGIAMAFQVTSPFDNHKVLMPHALVLHVNPSNFQEGFNQKVERIQTRGGFVEQHWGHELTTLTASGSTGAFMNIYNGLSSVMRQRTIAWDRYRDLFDLFLNNGALHDPYGNIVLHGNLMLMYDRGTYIGSFRTFEVEETDTSPFSFNLSWTFKVEETISQYSLGRIGSRGSPQFQAQNINMTAPVTRG
jgi:hypothetical protein